MAWLCANPWEYADFLTQVCLELEVSVGCSHDFQIQPSPRAADWSMTNSNSASIDFFFFLPGEVGFLDIAVAFYIYLFIFPVQGQQA